MFAYTLFYRIENLIIHDEILTYQVFLSSKVEVNLRLNMIENFVYKFKYREKIINFNFHGNIISNFRY